MPRSSQINNDHSNREKGRIVSKDTEDRGIPCHCAVCGLRYKSEEEESVCVSCRNTFGSITWGQDESEGKDKGRVLSESP